MFPLILKFELNFKFLYINHATLFQNLSQDLIHINNILIAHKKLFK